MAYRFTRDDVAFLSGDEGRAAITDARSLSLTSATLIGDLTLLRRRVGERAGAVAETVALQRRAAQHWRITQTAAAGWLLTDEALQQASPPRVAEHRAKRLAEASRYSVVHDVTCSVGADLVALATAASEALVVGSDIDRVRLAMARHNLSSMSRAVPLLLADATRPSVAGALRYADPARRDGAGRRISSADTIPTVAALDAVPGVPPPVLRLPPGLDFDALARPGEIELVSLDGVVREAVSWPAELATVRRRATVLTGADTVVQFTDTDDEEDAVTGVGRFLVEPDAAVIRAHLVRQFAARHRLTRIDEHLAYLSGDVPPAGLRAFEVLDAAPFALRTVRGWAARDAVGTLEIKQRGTSIVPDELRKQVRPHGDRRVARTLIAARVGRSIQAWWCRAVVTPEAGLG